VKPSITIQRDHQTVPLEGASEANLFFGGSFDPPHLGHSILPAMVADQLEQQMGLARGACRLVYVPTARSPHKEHPPTADQHRIEMLKIGLKNVDRDWTIWTQELCDAPLNADQPSYWVDTWGIANALLPNSTNRFLIGADQALSMHRWHRYREFWKDAVVMMRNGFGDVDGLSEALDGSGVWSAEDLEHWRSCCVEIKTLPWSSSAIRQQLSEMSHHKNTRIEGLDPGVQSYILEHVLYR